MYSYTVVVLYIIQKIYCLIQHAQHFYWQLMLSVVSNGNIIILHLLAKFFNEGDSVKMLKYFILKYKCISLSFFPFLPFFYISKTGYTHDTEILSVCVSELKRAGGGDEVNRWTWHLTLYNFFKENITDIQFNCLYWVCLHIGVCVCVCSRVLWLYDDKNDFD